MLKKEQRVWLGLLKHLEHSKETSAGSPERLVRLPFAALFLGCNFSSSFMP